MGVNWHTVECILFYGHIPGISEKKKTPQYLVAVKEIDSLQDESSYSQQISGDAYIDWSRPVTHQPRPSACVARLPAVYQLLGRTIQTCSPIYIAAFSPLNFYLHWIFKFQEKYSPCTTVKC